MSNETNQQKKGSFYSGAALLAVSATIVKILGGIFKIPLARILSEEAYGDFNSAYNIYSLFLTIATAGFPVALSKSVAEANALNRHNQVRRTFRAALWIFIVLGGFSFVMMFFFPDFCASVLLNNYRARNCVLALSVSVFCTCIASAYRGFAQGHQNMKPTSFSQMIESLFKLVVGLGLVFYIGYAYSTVANVSEMQAVGATIGVSVGSVASLIYLIFSQRKARDEVKSNDVPDRYATIIRYLLSIAIPITLGSASTSIVTLIDTNQVMGILASQFTDAAQALVGTAAYAGKTVSEIATDLAAQPYGLYSKTMSLYNLPAFFMVPFTASVIPAVSAAFARKNYQEARMVSESGLKIGFLVACPMGIGLSALAGPICQLVLGLDASAAGPLLSVLGIAAIFICITNLCQSILNACGKMWYPIISVIIGGVVKIVVNRFLVSIPSIGIYGAPYGTLACFLVAAALNLFFVKRFVPQPPRYLQIFPKITISCLIMGAAAWGVQGLLTDLIGNTLSTGVGIVVAVAIYFLLIVLLKVFNKQDMELMPKGDKIAKILKIQ